MDHLFGMRPELPGFRLQRLEVFNWGTFDSTDGCIHRFEPHGRTSLLVGHNGTGKSTLVDAILTLFVDSRTRNYNVAAGAKKTERTPKSYIQGAYDRTADDTQASVIKYLRPGGDHFTALSAVFRDEQLDRTFTLTQVLYLKADGTDEKVYAIADEAHQLKDDLAGLLKSDEVRDHLKRRGYQITRAYVEYIGWITRRTQMRGKAVDIFNQTVHVKDIQSLNAFIRRHMLEANDWRDKVQRLLTHFNDLSIAHLELVRARRAEELLTPVEANGVKYRQQVEEIEHLQRQIAAASTYFPVEIVRLFEPTVAEQKSNAAAMKKAVERMDADLKEKREAIRQLTNEIERAGGERLRAIPELIRTAKAHLGHKKDAFTNYHAKLSTCGIKDVVGSPESFAEMREQLRATVESAATSISTVTAGYEDAIGSRAALDRQLREEREELTALQQRRTNLPARFAVIRSQICSDLSLDENVLPFAAELITVDSEQRRWEASIELVLRSFALSLLVPERFYQRVRRYVEETKLADARGTGQRLDYICVGKPIEPDGDRIAAGSLLNKLQFKPRHDLGPWVRGEILKRFDFRCCDSVDEFNDVPRLAMTANRHVKFGPERHQKDDRPRSVDPRYFVLGWDNATKRRLVADLVGELEVRRNDLQESIRRTGAEIERLENIRRAASAALDVTDFDSIDVARHQREIAELRAEKQELEEANDVVKGLRERLSRAEEDERALSRTRDEQLKQHAKLEDDISRVTRIIDDAAVEVRDAKKSGHFEAHESFFDVITESLGDPQLTIEDVFIRRDKWEKKTSQQVLQLANPLQKLAENLVNKMSAYLREFPEQSADLDATVQSLPSFLGLLDQVRSEDLPRYEKQFKDRLNDEVTKEIALFNTELRQERKQIEEKIAQLNEALAGVEYNRGTLMQLEPRPVQDRDIDQFRRSLRECLDESLEHTDEANEARFHRIKALVERLASKEQTTWRNKVIDVRNWYDFAAKEIVRESQSLRSCYDGSSGQSGGEKAKLAFTILVAAIAYQFDVDPSGNTGGRFQFVVVDEMFSKVDDQNAAYALKLFRQFGLQLLIVAPLDAKARVTEPFVDRYLHTVKDPETHRSQLYSMTAQEYDKVVAQFSSNGHQNSKRPAVAK